MNRLITRIVPMTKQHEKACEDIVAESEPWKTLKEGIDFCTALKKKKAYVCLLGRTVAGFVLFHPEPVFARGGYLRAIGVAPALRNKGIGRRLLSFAEKITAQSSPNIYLCVSSFNKTGQAFYRKCGYRKIGKIDDLIKKNTSEYIFWKKLR